MDASAERALLAQLRLEVSRRLDGMLQGDHRGLVPGPGSEAGEARAYVAGDDVRRIDWAVTARTGLTHVRDTIAERELHTTLVVDLSPSLDFGTAALTKRELALRAASAVALLAARHGNRVGAVVVGGAGRRAVPPRSGQLGAMALLHTLVGTSSADGAGATELGGALRAAAAAARRRGLVVVVSDFLSADDWAGPLRVLGARHDVLCLEVVDPRELELPDVGVVSMVDPETGRSVEVPTGSAALRRRYAEAAAAQRAAIAAAVRRAGAGHVRLRTDADWRLALASGVRARPRPAVPPAFVPTAAPAGAGR